MLYIFGTSKYIIIIRKIKKIKFFFLLFLFPSPVDKIMTFFYTFCFFFFLASYEQKILKETLNLCAQMPNEKRSWPINRSCVSSVWFRALKRGDKLKLKFVLLHIRLNILQLKSNHYRKKKNKIVNICWFWERKKSITTNRMQKDIRTQQNTLLTCVLHL